ncbi:hypothetical protein BN59_00143 [Legionella massiliensis]|uniref:Uncharacterized protein n=1 Tax=Legionella massiliensis TaxID=1034943 RepID=A0A078KW04_9GAMM|nr:hypothetical protein [Legionella massiliensis]CDZ75883.1 hypothetical protein BN59_00143 [Legionella massiliensis]CEE11621.1 hypothetical protein BN1094_00143 [Legionella massiliensis]
MLEQQEISNFIARDIKELSNFVLDLCGFTLDEAGYDSKAYVFYLNVAFSHQAILQSEEWHAICKAVADANQSGRPVNWAQENQDLHKKIVAFAQSIVTEVTEASQDNLAIKLIKTSYLSNLDRAKKSTEHAIRHLAVKPGQNLFNVNVSTVLPPEIMAQESVDFIGVLKAQRAYLNSLLELPFVLEKLCIRLAENKPGANYQPRKTAEMLAKTLDTIDAALNADEADRQGKLIRGLKLALAVTMPDVQFADHELVDMLSDEFLPFVNKIIESHHTLGAEKAKVFPKNDDGSESEEAIARRQLLATMDVQFDSIQDILVNTLLEPANQCSQAITGTVGLGLAAVNALVTDNQIDRLAYIGTAFENFDKIAAVSAQIDPSLLPSWLNQANGYYQQVRTGATVVEGVAQTALRGLGAFYDYAVALIPKAVRNYLSRTDSLTRVLNQIDEQPNDFQLDKVMAYFAFYDLVKAGAIQDDDLKSKLFDAYMSEVVKADTKLRPEEFLFKDYKQLENQLRSKFNLQQPLAAGIANVMRPSVPTASLIGAVDFFKISSPQKLEILILVNRLQTLESKFDSKMPVQAFNELIKAVEEVAKYESEALKNFHKEFLVPAMLRMQGEYQTKRLIPLLETLLQTTTNETHKLRVVYSKLKENINLSPRDINFLNDYITNHGEFGAQETEEFDSFKALSTLLPPDKKKLENSKWLTPSEKNKQDAAHTLETITPGIQLLLDVLQDRLDEQLDSCKELTALSSNERITKLAAKKLEYIAALNGLINQLRAGLETPHSDLQGYLLQMLQGDLAAMTAEPREILAANTAPGKLLDLAWNIWPSAADKLSPTNMLAYRLLTYYLKQTENQPLLDVVQAEESYKVELNSNPVPALMKELNDPLAPVNIIPSQEKIMDAIVQNLVEAGKKSAFSWGVNYVQQVVAGISREQLVRFLPYPFLAELALQAIQSETVQARISPIVNSLMNEYGGVVSDKLDEFTKIAKSRLYPILGIELQKTIEAGAYNYMLNPDSASAADRDSFAMYYLQYREMKINSEPFDEQAVIQFLFAELLADNKPEQQEEIKGIIAATFDNLDAKLPDFAPPKSDAIKETELQLEFLIGHLDLSDHSNDTLIKLALVNRLLVMAMDAAEQLGNAEQVTRLQEQAIRKLSDTLEKINELSVAYKSDQTRTDEDDDEGFVLMSNKATPESMVEVISGANKRAAKLQLSQVKARINKAKDVVDKQVNKHQAMLSTKEPLLGLSVWEWEYKKSTSNRIIVNVLLFLAKYLGPIFTWSSIISAILAGKGTIAVLAISGGLSATGIGLAVVAGIAVLNLIWNVGRKFYENLAEFKRISEETPSLSERAGKITLLVLKCIGLALAKTLFLDFIAVKLATLFAFGPFTTLRNAFRAWPSKDRVEEEQTLLLGLQTKLAALQELVDKQINHIEKKTDPETEALYEDQSQAIDVLVKELDLDMPTVETLMNGLSSNDARFTIESYQEVLDAYQTNFADLKKEFVILERLLAAQAAIAVQEKPQNAEVSKPVQSVEKVPVQVTKETKAVVVSLEAYKAKLNIDQPHSPEQPEVKQQGYVSRFWNWLRAPKTTVVQQPELQTNKAASSVAFSTSQSFSDWEKMGSVSSLQLGTIPQSTLEPKPRPLSDMESSWIMVDSILDTLSVTHAANDEQHLDTETALWRRNKADLGSRASTMFPTTDDKANTGDRTITPATETGNRIV